jgi:hypothetical protein
LRELREWLAGPFAYDFHVPMLLTVFAVGTTYSSINPILSPICVLYFLMAYMVLKYCLLHVHTKPFETGGAFWPLVVDRLFVGMLVYQLTMIGVLGLKEAAAPSAALVPTPILTLLLWRYVDTHYRKPAEFLPQDAANNPKLVWRRVPNMERAASQARGAWLFGSQNPKPEAGPLRRASVADAAALHRTRQRSHSGSSNDSSASSFASEREGGAGGGGTHAHAPTVVERVHVQVQGQAQAGDAGAGAGVCHATSASAAAPAQLRRAASAPADGAVATAGKHSLQGSGEAVVAAGRWYGDRRRRMRSGDLERMLTVADDDAGSGGMPAEAEAEPVAMAATVSKARRGSGGSVAAAPGGDDTHHRVRRASSTGRRPAGDQASAAFLAAQRSVFLRPCFRSKFDMQYAHAPQHG